MKIQVFKVKDYSSSYKHVLLIDGEPIVMTRSEKRMSGFLQYLDGFDIEIKDGAIRNKLDKYRVKVGA